MANSEGNYLEELPNISELFHVGSFMNKWCNFLEDEDLELERKEMETKDFAEEMNIDEDIVKELEDVCHVNTLACPAEDAHEGLDYVSLANGIPYGAELLQTIKYRCMDITNSGTTKAKARYSKGSWDMEYNHLFRGESDNDKREVLKDPTVLLQVIVHRAGKDLCNVNQDFNSLHPERELLVVSSQSLADLREKIVCASDMAYVTKDMSETPYAPKLTRAHDAFPSAFFFIENVFYNDLKNPLSQDISRPIQDWLKEGRPGLPTKVDVKSIKDVKFDDLHIRLGYPYLFCHQGNCEHLIIFTDIRYIHNNDCQDLSQYPLLINKPGRKRHLCMVCKTFCAKWMTRGDSFSSLDPSYFCETCFHMLHYDAKGKKLGSFTAYPYIDCAVFS